MEYFFSVIAATVVATILILIGAVLLFGIVEVLINIVFEASIYWPIFRHSEAYILAIQIEAFQMGEPRYNERIMTWMGRRHGIDYSVLKKSLEAAHELAQ